MKLKMESMKANTRTRDIVKLQDALGRLGFTITDPEGFFGRTTADSVRSFQRVQGLAEGDGEVDEATIEALNRSLDAEARGQGIIRGRVTDAHGNGVGRREVRAFAVGVRDERLLGRAQTDTLGGYRILYARSGSMDVQVRVFRSGTQRTPLLTSPLILGALDDEVVNLALGEGEYRGRDEFSDVSEMVDTVLGDAPLPEATDERALIFLARASGLATAQVEHYLMARDLERDTEVPAAVYYGLLRSGAPRDPDRLLEEQDETHSERLRTAVRANIIDPNLERRINRLVADLGEAAIGRKLSSARQGMPGLRIGELFELSRLTDAQRRRFLAEARDNREPMADFWARLRSTATFNREQVDEIQLLLQLAGVTLNRPALVRVIREQHDPRDAQELAALERDDWLALLRNVEPPASFVVAHPEDPDAARSAYADAIMTVVAKSFPTARVLARWNRDPDLGTDDFRSFARNNPGFEFRATTVAKYLRENSEALNGIAESDRFAGELQSLHRVFSLVPGDDKFEGVDALWRGNLRSAHAVTRTGAAAFHAQFEPLLGADLTGQVFANARKKTAMSLATLVQYSPLFQGANVGLMGNIAVAEPPDAIPEWRTLFGALDFCDCRHCRSILSPAAYFVDLLQFLETASLGEQNGLTALLERHRPDLAQIQLDCRNTNTALPYIDLVNEVLENAVINGVFSLATSPAFQTRATPPELRANPEHVLPAAYDLLAEATFPWSLPFNLWHEERRIYLGHLNIETWELMDVLHREGDLPEPIDRAAAYLNLTALQREIITGEAIVDHGLGAGTTVSRLLRDSQTQLPELEALLRARFVNPDGIEIEFELGTCDLDSATLALDNSARRRLHRFRRLQQASGWSVFDLDLVIETLGGGSLDSDLLIQLSFVKRLEKRVGLPIPELLSWWSRRIPTRADEGAHSLYRERFLNPTVANPLNPVTAIFGLNNAATELANPQPLLDNEGRLNGELSPLLTGGLNVTEEALRLLIDRVLPSSELNLDNLSQLFRVASFSRALGMSVAQYLTLVELTGEAGVASLAVESGDFLALTPSQTWDWLELRDRFLKPGFRIEDIEYLLLHRESGVFRAPVGDAQTVLILERLQAELRKLPPVPATVLENPVEPPVLEEVLGWLGQKLPLVTAEAEQVLQIAAGVSELSLADQTAFVVEQLAPLLDPDAFLAATAGADRLLFLYRALLAQLSRTLVMQQLAAALQIEVALTEALLVNHLAHPDTAEATAISVFLAPGFLVEQFSPIAADAIPPASVAVIRRMAKLAFVFNRLAVRSLDVGPLLAQAEFRGWLDLRTLPIRRVNQTDALPAWLRLAEALDLNRRLFTRESSLFGLFAMAEANVATRESVAAFLAEHLGWDMESLIFLTGPDGYAFAFPADFGDARGLLRLEQAFGLIELAGVSGAQIWSWNLREADAQLALRIKAAAKAVHSVQGWLEVAPPLADRLRRLRRDHLVDFLIANHNDLDSPDDLYEQLLIDPQMEPCFLTSRIKQAISSVQLFVQRVFLGLEPTVRFNAEQSAEWQWRKHYRFREAALKVLLFPENFAEPELRDNKSPLFRQLEQNLLQEEVTAESVERAYAGYLRSLDTVARLEISGLYVEGIGSGKIVHIFARTHGQPQQYFYRRWIGESYFTPWESVEVKIEGNHLIPVVYNRRLWLIWPVFEDRVLQSDQLQERQQPKKFHRIRLAWSQYRDGKWTSVKTSQTYIQTFANKPFRHDPKRQYYFWAEVKDEALCVQVFHMNIIVDEFTGVFGAFEAGAFGHVPSSFDLNPEQPNQLFCFEGCQEDPKVYVDTTSGGSGWHERRAIPYRTNYLSQARYMKTRQTQTLSMFSKIAVDSMGRIIEDDSKVEVILRAGEHDKFDITPPHQYLRFVSQAPFFVEHRDRAFFVIPHDVADSGPSPSDTLFMHKDQLDLGLLDNVAAAFEPAAEPPVVAGRRTLVTAVPAETSTVYSAASSTVVIDRQAPEPEVDVTVPAFVVADALPQSASGPQLGGLQLIGLSLKKKYELRSFYHPYTCLFIEMLNRFGVNGLLAPARSGKGLQLHRQLTPDSEFRFSATYGPTDAVAMLYPFSSPIEKIDFTYGGAYSDYNWELFFHIPLLIANRLSQNQRFEEAQRWFHYIFDPTETDDEGLDADEQFRKFWKIKPFYQASSRENVEQILRLINQGDPDYEAQVEAWEADPFNPHLIARLRLVAYMKLVVMKYLDNLIAWADQLFRRDTIETINEAAQLYVLAGRILGRKPVEVSRPEPAARNYNQVRTSLDALSNSLVSLENILFVQYASPQLLQFNVGDQGAAGKYTALKSATTVLSFAPPAASAVAMISMGFAFANPAGDSEPPDQPPVLYFCAPKNDKLLAYWDKVADRLFKIRNCMNIEGVERTLVLFEPPIDPALLVKAAAAGVDLSSALDDLNAPLPHYRFSYLLPQVIDFCNDVKALGAALLSALEKKDAEALSLLRSGHEARLLRAVQQVKENAIAEAKETVTSLEAARATAEFRNTFNRNRQLREEVPGRPGLIAEEVQHEGQLVSANDVQLIGQGYDLAANIAFLFPDMKIGVQGISSPEITFVYGGTFFGRAYQAFGSYFRMLSSIESHNAQMASIKAGYRLRAEDWGFQADTALMEIDQIDGQIAAARIRVAIAERELENHGLQIRQSDEVDDFLRNKFSNEDRYGQLVQEIATIYFQAYQSAYDLARRTERCFRFELGVENTNFIEFGYWDSLKKGLLAGELLQKDLRRMQAAYLEQNRREFEITQQFALDLLDAGALMDLRETGSCEFEIPELALDLVYPGHYMRRIQSVSVSFACLVGPYANVNATLTLVSNRVRMSGNTLDNYAYEGINDPRFRHNRVGVQAIVTSATDNDSGLFQFDFRDERYRPFEGAGVISRWGLSLPENLRSFDYRSISTVVLRIGYTARNGGDALRTVVESHVSDSLNNWLDELAGSGAGLLRLISLRSEFPNALHRLLTPAEGQTGFTELGIEQRHFPYFLRGRQLSLTRLLLVLRPRDGATIDPTGLAIEFQGESGSVTTVSGLVAFDWADSQVPIEDAGEPWRLELSSGHLDAEQMQDVQLLVQYTVG